MRTHLDSDPRLERTIHRVVHPRHGIIRRIAEMPVFPDTPNLFIANAIMVNAMHFRVGLGGVREHPKLSSGAGLSRSECLWAVVGEAIERYSGSIYFDDDLRTATADELGADAVAVDDFVLYDEEQYETSGFPFCRYDRTLPRRWTKGRRLLTDEAIWVPAQMVWLGYGMIFPHENVVQNVSTGLAAGDSLEGAIFTGLREAVERDAFVSHWLLREPGVRISLSAEQIDSFPPGFAGLVRSPHAELVLRRMDNEFGIPVVCGILQDRISGAVAVGAACHPALRSAIYKATLEAWHTRYWGLELVHYRPGKLRPEEVSTFERHVRFYRDPENLEHIEFLLDGPAEPVDLADRYDGDRAAANRRMATALKAAGYDVITLELTTADVADLGLHVARVFVPGLQPIYCGTEVINMDRKRLGRFAQNLGRTGPVDINLAPHPFP